MHVRYSNCLGIGVVDDRGNVVIGTISGIFLHPDLGKVEGLFVRVSRGFQTTEEFLSVSDIAHWGRNITVRDEHALSPLEERVRLQQLWDERRAILGQRMVTETGKILGRCKDVQFETTTFRLEWLFPRKFFRHVRGVPANAVIEVRPDAVVVRDVEIPAETTTVTATNPLEAIGGTTPAQG